jgi:hypothetical protein
VKGATRSSIIYPGPGLPSRIYFGTAGRRVALASSEDSLTRALDAGAGSRLDGGDKLKETQTALGKDFEPTGFAELTALVDATEIESLGRLERISLGSRQDEGDVLTTRVALELADEPLEARPLKHAEAVEKGAYAGFFQSLPS